MDGLTKSRMSATQIVKIIMQGREKNGEDTSYFDFLFLIDNHEEQEQAAIKMLEAMVPARREALAQFMLNMK